MRDEFNFVESAEPDFIIFGPYGNDIPAEGHYVRIGYFCENFKPDMSTCEWAFGVPREEEIAHSRYKRIQWHGIDPVSLTKKDISIEKIIKSKTSFCNFFYSNRVPYREEFFKQLSKYKRVDAPGKSMNNMASIDGLYPGNRWESKRRFLSAYKFTIAFENYIYPGYQTEKLYDAMLCNSLPIYCGDPLIHEVFNTKSFINASDHMHLNYSKPVQALEHASQADFVDMRPQYYTSLKNRAQRKIKSVGRGLKMRLQFKNFNFKDLIDQIVEIDKDPDKYASYLLQPWFKNNIPPVHLSSSQRWREIFMTKSNIEAR